MNPKVVTPIPVVNGDFSAGNTGFTSQYTYVANGPGQTELFPEGLYSVHTNPNDLHSGFISMGDHTTGSGLMMIINGDANTTKIVWQGTTNQDLIVGRKYDFSAWVADVCCNAHASLTFKADSQVIGTLTLSNYGVWNRLFGTFTAQSARPVLSMTNAQPAAAGNDFAIDDIAVFGAEPSTTAVACAPNPSAFGQSVTCTATVTGAAGTPTGTIDLGVFHLS